MVLDTDTYNEIDDQFALVYALLSDQLRVEAIYAAPFFNRRSDGPADGMEKSYQEIGRILERMARNDDATVFRGSKSYLPSPETPVCSPAAQDLIEKALAPRDGPLYTLAIGAITNVASAILLEPEIIEHIVVVWLGGQPHYWHTAEEFNLGQDPAAARVVFGCGVPLVYIPCKNVAEHLRTTLPEMETYVKGRGAIGDYLYEIFEAHYDDHYARSKVIWDVSAVAYLNDPAWVPTELRPSPILQDNLTWAPEDPSRHVIRQAIDVDRDAVFGDLFRKLQSVAEEGD
jgi:inosine-uridine nucleoside N-ribohydrolase